eukprot:5017130-Pyramimonas_sp.AAC.1
MYCAGELDCVVFQVMYYYAEARQCTCAPECTARPRMHRNPTNLLHQIYGTTPLSRQASVAKDIAAR